MASWYIRSGAAGAGTGADWANAFTTLAAAITASTAGDTFYVAADHAGTQASALTLTFKGTNAAPDRVLCVNQAGSVPPVAADLRTTATVTTTGANGITIAGNVYIYGIQFNAGDGANTASLTIGATAVCTQTFQACDLELSNSSSASNLLIGPSIANGGCLIDLINTTMTYGHVTQGAQMRGGTLRWSNTPTALGGAIFPTNLFKSGGQPSIVTCDGVDLSPASTGKTLVQASNTTGIYQFINSRFGSAVTVAATPTSPHGTVTDVIISDNGATGYRQERYRYAGTLTAETVIVRSGGASDGVQALSHKIVTTANAKPYAPFESFPLAIWNPDTGSSVTLTVEMVNDGVTLTNADAWLEVEYLGSSSHPTASLVSSGIATPLTAGANLTTSSETWTTTGLSSPVKQLIAVTFTPQMAGYVRAVLKVARVSTTLYLDPKLTLS